MTCFLDNHGLCHPVISWAAFPTEIKTLKEQTLSSSFLSQKASSSFKLKPKDNFLFEKLKVQVREETSCVQLVLHSQALCVITHLWTKATKRQTEVILKSRIGILKSCKQLCWMSGSRILPELWLKCFCHSVSFQPKIIHRNFWILQTYLRLWPYLWAEPLWLFKVSHRHQQSTKEKRFTWGTGHSLLAQKMEPRFWEFDILDSLLILPVEKNEARYS